MLSAREGTTIAAIMEATGWQAHSIRAFFAVVVRKREKLNLVSEIVDGKQLYKLGAQSIFHS